MSSPAQGLSLAPEMIVVDNALRARAEAGRPIRVGVLGAGFMAQGLTNSIVNDVPGMRLSAIYGRKVHRAKGIYEYAGRTDSVLVNTQDAFEDAVRSGKPVITEDPYLLSRSEQIDVIVDTTGSVEFGARLVLDAFEHGKDVVLMNAEIDATIAPILQTYATKYGRIL